MSISHLSWNWRLSTSSKRISLTWHCCEKGIASWYLRNIPSSGDVLSFIQLNRSCFWGYNILHAREPSEHNILTGLVHYMVWWYTRSLMWDFQISSNNLQTMRCSPLFELNTYFLYCMLHCVLLSSDSSGRTWEVVKMSSQQYPRPGLPSGLGQGQTAGLPGSQKITGLKHIDYYRLK